VIAALPVFDTEIILFGSAPGVIPAAQARQPLKRVEALIFEKREFLSRNSRILFLTDKNLT